MGTAPDNLIEEAERKSTTDEFYWAITQHMKTCKGQADHLDELESAIQWCIDHNVMVDFTAPLTIHLRIAAPTGSFTKLIMGEHLLDVIEYAKEFVDKIET